MPIAAVSNIIKKLIPNWHVAGCVACPVLQRYRVNIPGSSAMSPSVPLCGFSHDKRGLVDYKWSYHFHWRYNKHEVHAAENKSGHHDVHNEEQVGSGQNCNCVAFVDAIDIQAYLGHQALVVKKSVLNQ